MQLVLNDQIWRAQAHGRVNMRRWAVPLLRMSGIVLNGAIIVIGVLLDIEIRHISVPVAFAAHIAEQCGCCSLSSQSREFVHCGDHERRHQPIDLLIGRQHRYSFGYFASLRKGALPPHIRAVDEYPATDLVHIQIPAAQRLSAPRAGNDLQHIGVAVAGTQSGLLDFPRCLRDLLRRHVRADPQADAEWLIAP